MPRLIKEIVPAVLAFVYLFAAAMKEARVANYDHFYTVVDPKDENGAMAATVKRVTDMWLSTCGRNQNGQPLPFPAVFEEQIKMGAITACCGTVLWKNDVKGGRVAFETVDPRFVWMDHTFRNLYRIRRIEIDLHELNTMMKMVDSKKKSIFNEDEMLRLQSDMKMDGETWQREMSGHGHET